MIETLLDILSSAWLMTGRMAPYLLLGFFAAGLLSVLIPPAWVGRHLGGRGPMAILKATLFGIPLPLCSCGVIPVAAGLRRQGAGKGAVAAFLASTPQTGADSILATYGMMGPVFAIVRPLVALASGLLCGAAVAAADKSRSGEPYGGIGTGEPDAGAGGRTGCSTPAACCSSNAGGGGGRFIRALKYGFVTIPRDMALPLLVGLAAAGVISALVPDNLFAAFAGGGLAGMLAVMLLAIPMYVCATGAIPVAAALVAKGVSPGAALVFLIAGPATNAATISAALRLLGRRGAAVYLAVLAAVALASGAFMDAILSGGAAAVADICCPAEVLPSWVNHVSAAVLFAILLAAAMPGAILRKFSAGGAVGDGGGLAMMLPSIAASASPEDSGGAARTIELKIWGMTCGHCAESVRNALAACPGVESVGVDIGKGMARVRGVRIEIAAIVAAVRRAGFEAEPT